MLTGFQPFVVSDPRKAGVIKPRPELRNVGAPVSDQPVLGQLPTAQELINLQDYRWDPQQMLHRTAVTDAMWGAGVGYPGADNIFPRILGQLPLHPAAMMLDMACDHGGMIRRVKRQYGLRSIGMTAAPPKTSDLEIHDYTNSLIQWSQRFDAVLMPMILGFLADKETHLGRIADVLRPRGHLAILEMTLERSLATTAFSRWMDQEPVRPAPISVDALKSLIAGQGLTIIRVEDVTSLYAEAIRHGLKKLSDVSWAQDRTDPRYAIMQSEAIDWATRLAALGQGLRVHTIHAVRPSDYGDLSFVQSNRDEIQ